MRGEPEGGVSASRLQAGRLDPEGGTRPRDIVRIAALFGAAAILIAESRLGLLDLHDVVRYSQADFDLDNLVQPAAGWLGMALAVTGFVYLIHIWAANRYRVSIGRLMVIVAMLAVLLQVFATLQQEVKASRTLKPPTTRSTSQR